MAGPSSPDDPPDACKMAFRDSTSQRQPSSADRVEYDLLPTDPIPRKRGCRSFARDLDNETIILRDDFGETILHAADLPGRILSLAMLRGLAEMLTQAEDARTFWVQLKHGLVPRFKAAKRRRPKQEKIVAPPKLRPLTPVQQAIIAALLDHNDCSADFAQAETMVRGLSSAQRRMWLKEPIVQMHLRRLRGEKLSNLDALVADLDTQS